MKKPIFLSLLLLGLCFSGCEDDDGELGNEAPATLDLAAESIEVDVTKTTDFTGDIVIRGIVKNIGNTDFVSGPGQQKVVLVEEFPGDQGQTVDEENFIRLDVGDSIEVSYSTKWNTANEFPPNYTLRIAYGPDIFIDGNEGNDDENNDNNSKTMTGAEIDAMF